MQLPHASASFQRHVRTGRFTARRLRTASYSDIESPLKACNQTVKDRGRAWEDSEDLIQDALADRDWAEEQASLATREIRLALASRSLDATKTAPYTKIFPDGLDYYVQAKLDEIEQRYQEFVTRVTDNLSADDGVVTSLLPKVKAALSSFQLAVGALSTAITDESVARSELEDAQGEWTTLMTNTHAELIKRVGKPRAERFFQRFREKSKPADVPASAGAAPAPA